MEAMHLCLWVAQAAPQQSPILSLVPMIAIFAIFYLVVMMPMRKRQRALQQSIANLKKGDRVLTTGGIYGEVVAVESDSILLKIADNVKVRFAKSAVASLDEEASKGGNPQ